MLLLMACGILWSLWAVVATGDSGDVVLVLVAGHCWLGIVIDGSCD